MENMWREGEGVLAFCGGEFPPGAGREGKPGELQRADAHTDQAQRGVSHGGSHAAHLAVFAFGEFKREPAGGDVVANANRRVPRRDARNFERAGIEQRRATRERAMSADHHAAARELRERGRRWDVFNLHVVFARVRTRGIEKAPGEGAFVGKKQQAFAVGIEPANRINMRWQRRGCCDVRKRAPARAGLGRELREHAVGFVERDEHGGSVAAAQKTGQHVFA